MYFFKPAAGDIEPIPGDLNLDRVVNNADVNLAAMVILGLEADPALRERTNINGDGQVNALDLQAIINVVGD